MLVEVSPVEVSIEMVIIRANGYKENLGRVAYWNQSFLRRAQHRLIRAWRSVNGVWVLIPVGIVLEPGASKELGHVWIVPTLSVLPFFLAAMQVNTGQAIVTSRLHGTGTEPLNQGWGTGAGAVLATSTTLSTETGPDLVTLTGQRTIGTGAQATGTNANDTYQVTAAKTATAAGTVTNAGLFDNVTIGSGNLYMAGDTLNTAMAINDSISFTNTVRYA